MTHRKRKPSKWLSFEEARDLVTERARMSKKDASEFLAKSIEEGKLRLDVTPISEVSIKGIRVMIDGTWLSLKEARDRVMRERTLTEDQAKKWITDELADKRMRWRAASVLFNGRVLDNAEAERYLRTQGGELASWQN